MKENPVETTLAKLRAPAPSPEARLRAKRAALAEFARVNAANEAEEAGADQGLWNAIRLFRVNFSHRRAEMKWSMSRWMAVGASVCVVSLGFSMVWPVIRGGRDAPMFQDVVGQVAEPTTANEGAEQRAPEHSGATRAEPAHPEPAQPPLEKPHSAQLQRAQPKDEAPRGDDLREIAAAPVSSAAASAPPPGPAPPAVERDKGEVEVTGMRQTLTARKDSKRATGVVDAVQADDIGKFPDRNLSESQQRISGVVAPAVLYAAAKELESRDKFQHFEINPIRRVADEPVSTFSVDVDTASYSFARRMLVGGELPQKDAVRIEEMVNYFDYAWPAPTSRKVPFQPTVVVSDSPWGKGRKLVHIGIKGYDMERESAPDANLVLLLDVSGSMNSPDKLPLAVKSMELLLGSLKPTDTVAIVVYAGDAGTVLEPTPVSEKDKILSALRNLTAGGSTAGAEGIELAYQLAEKNFRKNGVNRILLATDGDFNVGIDDTNELKGFIERKRAKGIYLSVLGFGEGNYRDELAQTLAQNGNGVAAYIDTLNEARKVLVREATSSLFTIAKDVKLQVEFNPSTVAEYRLVGYETRALRREDFNNDAVDAGDVGAGHTVTAIYEITPASSESRSVDESRYPENKDRAAPSGNANEYGYLKIRYKLPEESTSRLLEMPIPVKSASVPALVQQEVRFSTAVAGFAQLLRGGIYTGPLSYEDVVGLAQSSRGEDRFGYRSEFIELVRKADALQRK